MSGLFQRVPFRESRPFTILCLVLLLGMAAGLTAWPRPLKQERAIARKKEEGKVVPTDAYVPVWLRKGFVLDLGLVALLLVGSPWLGRRWSAGQRALPEPEKRPWKGWQTTMVAGLVLFAAWNNYPRLFLSMWGDEEFNASRFIVDEVSRGPGDAIEITPRSWTTTLWSFRKTTNHLGFSALARLSHDTFFTRKTGPQDPWFSEALIRLPVFVAGLLFFPALFWAARVWGLPLGLAALVGLLHPWFLRFGVDGRAYGLVMLAVPLLLAFLGRALQTGRWRWWALLGLGEFTVFWCYFGSLYLLLSLNAMALALIWTGVKDPSARSLQLGRWLVSGAIAAFLVIGIMAPCWPQFFEFLEQKPIAGTLDWPWWRDSFCELFFGAPWTVDAPGNPEALAVTNFYAWGGSTLAVICAVLALGVVAMAALGAARLARDPVQRWLLVLLLGAPALMLAHMAHSQIRPYAWYLAPYWPGLLFLLGQGWGSWTGQRKAALKGVWLTLWLAALLVILWPARAFYRNRPIEPSRDSVALYRSVTNPRNADLDKGVISGGFVFYTEGYDPAQHRFKNAEGLRGLMDTARRESKELYINVGMIQFARLQFPEIVALLEDEKQFHHVQTLHGLLPSTTREVFSWVGGASH